MEIKHFYFWNYLETPKANWKETGLYHDDQDFIDYHESNPEWFPGYIFETPIPKFTTFSKVEISKLELELDYIFPNAVKETFYLFGDYLIEDQGVFSVTITYPRDTKFENEISLENIKMDKYNNKKKLLLLLVNLKANNRIVRLEFKNQTGYFLSKSYFPIYFSYDASIAILVSNKIKRGLIYRCEFMLNGYNQFIQSVPDYYQNYNEQINGLNMINNKVFCTDKKVIRCSQIIIEALKKNNSFKKLVIKKDSKHGFTIQNKNSGKFAFILISHDNMGDIEYAEISKFDFIFSYYYKKIINEKADVLSDIAENLRLLGFASSFS